MSGESPLLRLVWFAQMRRRSPQVVLVSGTAQKFEADIGQPLWFVEMNHVAGAFELDQLGIWKNLLPAV